jgi:hypothetical protein
MNEDFRVKRFFRFFNSEYFKSFKFGLISWRPSLEPKKLRSIEIFLTFFMVPEIYTL